ncbi:pyridoxal-phosphate dependent enzyme [Echinicola marina]|uniref:1-aminocyclopropane-1-carboxylate deaminase/D-cysteine desulfhydrase n=1 Tax=Echinicola marina TaxID=2859768 RepID=UPI00293D9122|nr:pyridoxal-phosphate dependent enzyme [Echinicola marina]UCS94118.1 pyridoxal-phosphate dependent enzyme [Echinicola marina]
MISPYPYPHQKIISPESHSQNLEIIVKRLDLIHPLISGNKFFKLKYNLIEAVHRGHDTLLTFGGAYSNHIQASAAAAKAAQLKAIGIIRGEKQKILNPTLATAEENGMLLSYMDRESYRKKDLKETIEALHQQFGKFFLIPEGGTNELAIKGCKEIINEKDRQMDFICASIGTGGTITGLLGAASERQKVLGFSSLKGHFILNEIDHLLAKYGVQPKCAYEIFTEYHFGGYAKHKPELLNFIKAFNNQYQIPLDPIYTGKLFYGVFDLIQKGYFPSGSKIMLIHSGGLQGIEGFNQRHNESL